MDLPDAENRQKILRILLAQENLEQDFRYDELANKTEGYSGSDLKVKHSCIAVIAYILLSLTIFRCHGAEPMYCCCIQACSRTYRGRTEG